MRDLIYEIVRLTRRGSLKDHGRKSTAARVGSIVLRAAARLISVFAAIRDLADAPCEQAVLNALHAGLPKTLSVLEKRV